MDMTHSHVLDWLLQGDPAIQYQVCRDLLGEDRPELRQQAAVQGWGARFLEAQNPDGTWGRGFYQPKWTSSHYTLLDLCHLGLPRNIRGIDESLLFIAENEKGSDGGINPSGTIKQSDGCINGMFLNYACWFGLKEEHLCSVIDFLLAQRMGDGGYNCQLNRSGAVHSSVHTTIAVLEGYARYQAEGYTYRIDEVSASALEAGEFLLRHRLYKSDRTGEVIHSSFLKLSYPYRWYYNILRALDYFASNGVPWDSRMSDALSVLKKKQRSDGRWPLQAAHPGAVHFKMEESRKASRWNTLAALRVFKAYGENL